MKVIPANVHKGTADHRKHTEAFAKKAFTPVWLINGFTVDQIPATAQAVKSKPNL